jgi:MFS family permease
MPESRYEVLALFAGAMVAASLFVVSTGTLTPFLESAFRLSQTQLGLVLSVQMTGSLLATAIAGALTDRFGDKAVVLWSGWFMGTALILAGAVHNFHWVLFWLLAYGIGYAAVTPAGSHAIVFFFKREERGFAMGIRQCGVPVAGVVGSLLLPAVALHFNYQWALATAGIVTLVTCSIASILYREPKELEGERVSLSKMLAEMAHVSRDVRLVFMTLTSMALICVQMVLLAFLTLTLVHLAGYAVSFAAGIFTLSQGAAIAGRLSWGWMSDTIFRGSRAVPLAVVSGITAAVALGISLISTHTPLWSVCALAVALGFSAEGWFGVAVIAFAEIGGEEHSGSALGVALTWAFFAAFVSPTVFGAIAEVRGYAFAWRSLALLALVGIVPALLASAATRRFAARLPLPTA